MKKNKLKLFAALAGLSAVAAPIITLASCAKADPIHIDEKEKAKDLPKGERETSYTLKLASKMQEGETVACTIDDVTTTQAGFSVNVSDIAYSKDSDEVTAKVKIVATKQNAILEEGAKFTFSLTFVRKNAKGETLSTTKIANFSMTYVAPVVAAGLKLVGDKSAYSNPSEKNHVFTFKVGQGIEIPDGATFECDVTTTKASPGVTAKFGKDGAIYYNQKLYLNFELSKKEALIADNYAKFDFTISCSKDGKELWRQSFKDYQITYIEHQMYIFKDYQWEDTNAGDTTFYLYVAKNSDLHWGTQGLDIEVTTATGCTSLTVDKEHITEGEGYLYSYFIVPMVITPTDPAADANIDYTVKLSGIPKGKSEAIYSYTDMNIKYVAQKVEVGSHAQIANIAGVKNKTFDLDLVATTTPAKISCLLVPNSSSTDFTAEAAEYAEIAGTTVSIPVTITTQLTQGSIDFSLMLFGEDNDGNILWDQLVEGYKINYLNPVVLINKEITTPLDSQSGTTGIESNFEYSLIGDSVITKAEIFGAVEKSTDIADQDVDFVDNKIVATITPKADVQLTHNSYAKFDIKVTGTATVGGQSITWEKIFDKCKVTYDGTFIYDKTASRWLDTEPGEELAIFKFQRITGLSDIEVELENTTATPGYKADIAGTQLSNNNLFVVVDIEKTDGSKVFDDRAYAGFKLKFTGKKDGQVMWTKTDANPFRITYVSSVRTYNKTVKTDTAKETAHITLNTASTLKTGEYYKMSVSNQISGQELEVRLNGDKYTPTTTQFDANFIVKKTTAQPIMKGDSVTFDLQVDKYSEEGTIISQERIPACSITYDNTRITWDSSYWYTYKQTTGEHKSVADVNFNLSEAIGSDEELVVSTVYHKGGSADVSIEAATPAMTVVDKVATAQIQLSKTNDDLVVGDNVEYDIEIKCQKKVGATEVWKQTIKDCYIYMFAQFTPQQTEMTTSGTGATWKFDLSAKLDESLIKSRTIELTPRFKILDASRPSVLKKLTSGYQQLDSTNKVLSQFIGFSNPTSELVNGDWIQFKIIYDITYHGTGTTSHVAMELAQEFKLTYIR